MNGSVKAETAADARRERWDGHRAERRRQFVEAALRVLESGGTDLQMEAVAAEAGVTKPVLYRYFADKAALVDALAERGSQILLSRLMPAINSDGPALARIREAVGAYFAVIDEHPNLYWLLARRPGTDGARASAERDKELISTTLTAVISDALRRFGLGSGGAEPWAHGITGLVQSTGEWWLRRRSMSRTQVVEYVTVLIWSAFAGVLREAGIVLGPQDPVPAGREAAGLEPAAGRPAGTGSPPALDPAAAGPR
jgi:AcrR family transcriptional regulator